MTNLQIIKLLEDYRTHLLKLSSASKYNYESMRSFLNKNRVIVQKILTKAGTLHAMTIAPPPLVGGYVMNNVNPFDVIFDRPYGVDTNIPLSNMIEQAIGIIEADTEFCQKLETNLQKDDRECDVWDLIHPQIAEVSKKRMGDGYYADAVETACKAINSRVRDIVLNQTGEEYDGAVSPINPIIRIATIENKSGHDTQQGYMDIFAGVMTGIRNPKAHGNESITKEEAFRKLIMISLLMYKIDSRRE